MCDMETNEYQKVTKMLNQLITNTLIVIDNAERDLPQHTKRYAEMRADLTKVRHAKLIQYILEDLKELYEA